MFTNSIATVRIINHIQITSSVALQDYAKFVLISENSQWKTIDNDLMNNAIKCYWI